MSDRGISRRAFVRIGPLAGLPVALQRTLYAQGAAASQLETAIPEHHAANLDTDEILFFVANNDDKASTTYEEPVASVPGYRRRLGDEHPLAPTTALPAIWLAGALAYTVKILRDGHLLHTTDVNVIVAEHITILAKAHLYIKNAGVTPDQEARIVASFQAYDWNNTPDPHQYAGSRMTAEAGITPDMFLVKYTVSLKKQRGTLKERLRDGTRKEDRRQLNSVLTMYGQSSKPQSPTSAVWHSKAGADRPITEDGSGTQYTVEVIEPPKVIGRPKLPVDSVHQKEGSASEGPNTLEIVLKEKPRTCDDVTPRDRRIATVFKYPTFRLTLEPYPIRIGCVMFHIFLPVLWFRFLSLVLWSYSGIPKYHQLPQDLKDWVEQCLYNAAIVAGVVALVFTMDAAVAAFRVAFVDCVARMDDSIVNCLVPGLVLRTEPDPQWTKLVHPDMLSNVFGA